MGCSRLSGFLPPPENYPVVSVMTLISSQDRVASCLGSIAASHPGKEINDAIFLQAEGEEEAN